MLIGAVSRILATAWKIASTALDALLFNADPARSTLTVVTTIDTAAIGANPALTAIGIDAARQKTGIGTNGVLSASVSKQAGISTWTAGRADRGWRLDTSVEGREAKNENDAG